MRLTKYSHACVRFDDGDRALVIDPGVFSEASTALAGASAVLITHEHPDHLDEVALRAAAAANPQLRIWAPTSVVATLADLGERVTDSSPASGGAPFDAAGFSVQAFGSQHALVHPLIPIIANVGYLVQGLAYHPGDSFTVPNVDVQTLLVPTNAPWAKASEIVDFVVAVRAPQVFQIHDGLITETGAKVIEGILGPIIGRYDVEFTHLAPSATVTL